MINFMHKGKWFYLTDDQQEYLFWERDRGREREDCGTMVIIVENGFDDQSSNPGRD